jgi:hypothetical protein
MGSVFGGGGGGGGSAPDTTTQFIREAPGIEERKLELMDIARQTAQDPISIPDIQVQQLSPLEQAAITQAGQTGVGAGALQQAITGTQGAMAAPNISQFYNPFQSFVIDEINRQSAIRQNELAGRSVGAGAFGGARQGIQAAEEENRRLGQVGQAQAQGFQTALSAAQTQQAREQSAAAQLANLGQQQQNMAGVDIQRQLTAGGLQRQLGQAALDAARQTQLQRSAEPLQRLEFLSNIYAAGPKSTSGITAATLPQSSPLAQSIGTGLGVAQAYGNISSNPGINTAAQAVRKEGGIIDVAEIRKLKEGGAANEEDEDDFEENVLKINPKTGALTDIQRSNLMMRPIIASLLTAKKRPGQSEASAVAEAFGKGVAGQQEPALQIAKFDTALEAAKAKAAGKTKQTGGVIPESTWRKIPGLEQLPIGSIVQKKSDGTYTIQRAPKGEADSKIATVEAIQQIKKIRNLYQASGKPTGYFESGIKRTANKLFGTNPNLASLDATLELFNANFLKAMRGVQVSGIEQVKFEQILPNMNDAEGVFERKMDAVEELLVIRDKLQTGQITREQFLGAVNKVYDKKSKEVKKPNIKKEKDGSVTVSGK